MQRYGQESEFKDRLVAVNRVSKTVKGGKRFGFAALVVVGYHYPAMRHGAQIGRGKGDVNDVPQA